jgi:hypothetical protein
MPLLSFPSNVISRIFLIACTDGGRTARALKLVSHQFYQLVKPIELNTVVLQGQHGAWGMYGSRRSVPENARPAVHHVFLTNYQEIQGLRVSQSGGRPRMNDMLEDECVEIRAFEIAVGDVLSLLATTLRSITVVAYGILGISAENLFRNTRFPFLAHVNVNTPFSTDSMTHFFPPPVQYPPAMPALTSLYVDLDENPNHLEVVQQFLKACPTIRRVVLAGFIPRVHGPFTPSYFLGRPLPLAANANTTPIKYDYMTIESARRTKLAPTQLGDELRKNGFDIRFRPGNVKVVEVYPNHRGYTSPVVMDGLVVHPPTTTPPTYQELKDKWERQMVVSSPHHRDMCSARILI